jgi:hypothetical protein
MSPLDVRVDAAALTVHSGGRVWPFEVDLDTGAAVVDVDGVRRTLRPLRWREKLTLARCAGERPDLVDAALVEGRLTGSPLPDVADPVARAALAAVARWVNGFDPSAARTAVPLNLAALARVAVAAVRHTGLRPGELDDRPAIEVELLAAVDRAEVDEKGGEGQLESGPDAQPGASSGEDLFVGARDGVTRIVVVPDPGPALERPPSGGLGPAEDVPDPGDGPVARSMPKPLLGAVRSDPGQPSPARGDAPDSPAEAVPVARGEPGDRAEGAGAGRPDGVERPGWTGPPALSSVQAEGRRAGEDLPFLGGPASGAPRQRLSVRGHGTSAGHRYPRAPRTSPPAGRAEPVLEWAAPPTPIAFEDREAPAAPVHSPASVRSAASATGPAAAPVSVVNMTAPVPAAVTPLGPPSGSAPAAVPMNLDSIVDELTRRLERAVDDLGLDPGD